jgi:hypothetical protein
MIPTDADLVNLCNAIYSPTAVTGDWDYLDLGPDDGICLALKKLDGFDVVVFRGSITVRDWVDDIMVLPIGSIGPLKTPMGNVHAGFYAGMPKVWAEIKPLITQPVIVTGHSLGASRADILCGLMIVDGVTPVLRVVFGEPKPGLMDFGAYIAKVPGRSYRNGDAKHHDVVTDVPMLFPPLQFVHPTPIIVVTAEPTGDMFSRLGLFAFHHIELYQAAIAALQPKETAS